MLLVMRAVVLDIVLVAALFPALATHAADAPAPATRAHVDFAMRNDGNVARGRALFTNETRTACAKCHSIDGTGSKAGPDLAFAGDKFPRRELVRAILEPSASIAVGYGATVVETKNGELFQGIIKQSTEAWLELMDADGKKIRVATGDIREQRGNVTAKARLQARAGGYGAMDVDDGTAGVGRTALSARP